MTPVPYKGQLCTPSMLPVHIKVIGNKKDGFALKFETHRPHVMSQ
jgi:hypothetical protein